MTNSEYQNKKYKKSFTLVELMIVIAILAILSAIVIFALNPARLFDNFRDSKRVTDIQLINKAIVFMESWNQSGITYGTTTNLYISLPDSNPSCTAYTLPTLPAGFVYYCKPTSTYKNTDGTGWIPINFTVEGSNKYLSNLPIDPVNNSTYFYTYYPGGSYELTAILSNPNKNSINDEGSLTSTFEIGSPNRTWSTPLQRDKGLLVYWDFNEGTGTTVADNSGNNVIGTLRNGATWSVLPSGEKVSSFDENDDFANNASATPFSSVAAKNRLSWGCWFKGVGAWSATHEMLINKRSVASYISVTGGGLFRSNQINGVQVTGNINVSPVIGTWYFVMVTWDGSFIRSYVNGSLSQTSASLAGQSLGFGNDVLELGVYNGAGQLPFGGLLDKVRVYDRALSAEEIMAQYNNTKGRYQ